MRKREPLVTTAPSPPAPAAPAAPPPAAAGQPEWTGPYVLGRMLLVLVTVLLVSRPLIRGEDPGLASDFADPGGLVWVCLVLVGLVGWSLWRPWAGEEAIYLGPAEVVLLVLGLWQFIPAAYAPVRHMAWVAAWQWFALALAVFLLRQFARDPADARGLMIALLATAVAMAAEGAYQAAWPAKGGEDELREALQLQGFTPRPWEWQELARPGRVHGPYFFSSNLALALVLLLPGLTAAWLACRRGGGAGWHVVALAAVAMLAGAVLILTAAWMALAVALALWIVLLGVLLPRDGRAKVFLGLTCAMAAALLVGVVAGRGGLDLALGRIDDTWPAAWRLFLQKPWFGLGPEQFVHFYPREMAETAGAKERQPASALLTAAVSMGVVGVAGLVAVFVLFVRAVVRWWRRSAPSEGEAPELGRWEIYLGGMVGLVLVFVLRASGLPPNEILNEAIVAGVRAVAWFFGVALLERLRWPPRLMVGALTAGIAGVAAALLVTPGIDAPSVAGPLLLAMALVLAVVSPAPARVLSGLRPVTAVLPPVMIATTFGFFAFVFYPYANSLAAAARVRNAQVALFTEAQRTGATAGLLRPTPSFIRRNAIEPLEAALKEDPENLRTLVLLAGWYGQLWELDPFARDGHGNDVAGAYAHNAAVYAARARHLAPEAADGYLVEFDLRRRLAQRRDAIAQYIQSDLAKRLKGEAAKGKGKPLDKAAFQRDQMLIKQHRDDAARQRRFAAEALLDHVPKDPTDPLLRFHLAETYFDLGDKEAGRAQAQEAQRLDGRVGEGRKLSDRQSEQVRRWLSP